MYNRYSYDVQKSYAVGNWQVVSSFLLWICQLKITQSQLLAQLQGRKYRTTCWLSHFTVMCWVSTGNAGGMKNKSLGERITGQNISCYLVPTPLAYPAFKASREFSTAIIAFSRDSLFILYRHVLFVKAEGLLKNKTKPCSTNAICINQRKISQGRIDCQREGKNGIKLAKIN